MSEEPDRHDDSQLPMAALLAVVVVLVLLVSPFGLLALAMWLTR